MSDPFIGEIRMFGGNFAPQGWAFCDGSLLVIAENDALFNLIGTTYGGDGQETFALPNLMGRIPIHAGTLAGTTYTLGESAGSESVTLTIPQLPLHSHPIVASTSIGTTPNAQNGLLAQPTAVSIYRAPPAATAMRPAISALGGSQPHDNMMPFLCVTFIISLFGIFPS
jgi:microcystin-dependent protein